MTQASSPAPLRIPEIDGLRGIAILAILFRHWIVPIEPFSSLIYNAGLWDFANAFEYGVDLFFVVSGFLIGQILLKAARKPSGIATFYIRRVLRIWPVYYLFLGMCFFLGGRAIFGQIPMWGYFLFLSNLWQSFRVFPHGTLAILWSLGIEEQFYIFGPWLFYFFTPKKLLVITGFWFLISPFLRLGLSTVEGMYIWNFTPVRMDGICVGIFLATLLSRQEPIDFLLARRAPLKIATFGLLGFCGLSVIFLPTAWWGFSATSLLTLAFGLLLVTVLIERQANHENRALNSGILRFLGVRCYSLYLFHTFFYNLTGFFIKDVWPMFLVQTILTLGFAQLSWRYLEAPLIRYARRWSYS